MNARLLVLKFTSLKTNAKRKHVKSMASLNNFNLDEVRVKEPIIGLKMCLTKELAIRLAIMRIK